MRVFLFVNSKITIADGWTTTSWRTLMQNAKKKRTFVRLIYYAYGNVKESFCKWLLRYAS